MSKQTQPIIDLKDVRKLLKTVLRNWYIIVGAILVSAIAGLYYVIITLNGSLARIGISAKYNDKTNVNDYQDGVTGINPYKLIEQTIESIRMDVSYYQLDNEYCAVQNAEPTASSTGWLNTYFLQKKDPSILQIGNELSDSVPFRISIGVVDKECYEKNMRIRIINDTAYELSYNWHGQMTYQKGYFDSIITTPQLRMGVLKQFDKVSFDKIVGTQYAIQIHDKEDLLEKIRNHLDIITPNGVSRLMIEYRDILPERAIAFLDTLSKIYLRSNIKSQMEKNGKMIAGIDKLLQKTAIVLRDLQDSISRNKKFTGFDESLQEQSSLTLLTNLMTDKKKLEYQRVSMANLKNYLTINNDPGLPPPHYDGSVDPFIEKCLADLYNIELNKKDNLFSVTDKSISLVKGEYNFNTRKTNLLKYIKNTEQEIDVRLADMDKQIKTMMIPGTMEYNKYQLYALEMQRQLKVNEAMYMNLLEKRNNIIIAQGGIEPEYLLVEPPHLIRSDDTSRKKNTLASFLLAGLMSAGILVFLKNISYKRIECIEDLKEKQNVIPILGELLYINSTKEPFQYMIDAHSHPHESTLLQTIRTNIDFLLPEKKSKTILVTSHTSNEGKTFTAVNMAAILARANKKVLLLDMDLHKPNVNNALGIDTRKHLGMATLFKKEYNIKEVIIHTSQPNLDTIIVESYIKNAAEMLLSDVTKTIIDYASINYDYTIIDTPPVGLTSEALTLMKYSDINVYVINSALPYENSLLQANDIFENKKFQLFFLLNKVKSKNLQYYSKYYKSAYAARPKEFATSFAVDTRYTTSPPHWSGFFSRISEIIKGRRSD